MNDVLQDSMPNALSVLRHILLECDEKYEELIGRLRKPLDISNDF